MIANNLTWEQIKELAELAIESGKDFTLDINVDGGMVINIESQQLPWTTTTTTTPFYSFETN